MSQSIFYLDTRCRVISAIFWNNVCLYTMLTSYQCIQWSHSTIMTWIFNDYKWFFSTKKRLQIISVFALTNGRLSTEKSIYSRIMEDKIQIQDQFTGKLLNRILRLVFTDRHCPQTVPLHCPSTMSSDYAGGPCTNAFISYAFISIL